MSGIIPLFGKEGKQLPDHPILEDTVIVNCDNAYHNMIYLACGYGVPQGMRIETGYNINRFISFALSFGIGDNWSRDPQEGTLAILGTLRVPIKSSCLTPYLLICSGSTLTTFGGPDRYILLNSGLMYEITSRFVLRPEIGIALLSKHISGGETLFFGNTPEIRSETTKFSINIILEYEIF